jgi:hypothetical protein
MKRTFLFTLLLGSLFATQLLADTCPIGVGINWLIPKGWKDYLNTWEFNLWHGASQIIKVTFDNGYIRCQYSSFTLQSIKTYPQPTISSTSPWQLQADKTLSCSPLITIFNDTICTF